MLSAFHKQNSKLFSSRVYNGRLNWTLERVKFAHFPPGQKIESRHQLLHSKAAISCSTTPPTTNLLGVLLNRSLTFTAHTGKWNPEITSKLRAINVVFYSTWELKKSTLNTMFFAYIRSKMDYAAPAWQSLVSSTNMAQMENFQNRALSIATGQLVSKPVQTLRMEANVLAIKTSLKRKKYPDASQQTSRKDLLLTSKYHNGYLQDQASNKKQRKYQKYY